MKSIGFLLLGQVLQIAGLGFSKSPTSFLSQPTRDTDGKLLCRVLPSENGMSGGRKLDIWQLPGNTRAVSFEDALTYETMVSCAGAAPDCKSAEAEVSDIRNCPPCPCDLELRQRILESQQALVSAIQPRCTVARAGRPFDVLMLGLGGGVVHTFVRSLCPQDTRVRSVEIDSRFADVASRYFGLPLAGGVSEVLVGDALDVVRGQAARFSKGISHSEEDRQNLGESGWDLVVVDCFVGGGRTAPACRSQELVKDLKLLLKPGGAVLQHVWHKSPKDTQVASEFKSILGEYQQVFSREEVRVQPIFRDDPAWRLDDIITASRGKAPDFM